VITSYFEWAQDKQGYAWESALVDQRLHEVMERAFAATWERAQTLDVSLRRATIALGLERVAEATRLRGLFP
jgi:glutamate dehydrogenase/leucine dehydrogenase